jgi:hypothetical protein
MLISPIAHVALLQTDMNSGFRFCAKMGKKFDINGATCWKHAFVKSPNSANDDCRTYELKNKIINHDNNLEERRSIYLGHAVLHTLEQ